MVDRFIITNPNNNKKKKVKRLSSAAGPATNHHYYPSSFISKPCDQLFGPWPFSYSSDTGIAQESNNINNSHISKESLLSLTVNSVTDTSANQEDDTSSINLSINSSTNTTTTNTSLLADKENANANFGSKVDVNDLSLGEKYDYIPAPSTISQLLFRIYYLYKV